MIGRVLFGAGAVIVAMLPPRATRSSAPSQCLVLDVGAWTPSSPSNIWRSSRRLSLTKALDPWLTALEGRHGWRTVKFVPDGPTTPARSPAPEYDLAWVWLGPTPDSLVLIRPAMLSEGMAVRGTWSGDTLRGRAQAFSDAVDMVNGIARSPRANAYGLRYACKDAGAAASAAATVEQLRSLDRPDTALGLREDSVWTAELTQQLQHE